MTGKFFDNYQEAAEYISELKPGKDYEFVDIRGTIDDGLNITFYKEGRPVVIALVAFTTLPIVFTTLLMLAFGVSVEEVLSFLGRVLAYA